jgi:hypothetical protein
MTEEPNAATLVSKKQSKISDADYRVEYAREAGKLCFLLANDNDLADFFGVSKQTINAWKKQYPEFCQSMQLGKQKADAKVVEQTLRSADRYEHLAAEVIADAKTGIEHATPYIEQYAHDMVVTAFWLKNRRPDLWRDKQEHEHGGPQGGSIESKSTTTL